MSVSAYLTWFGIVFGALAIGLSYSGWRLIVAPKLPMPWRLYAWILLSILFLLPVVSMFATRYAEKLVDPLAWVTYIGLGLVSLVLTLLVIRDVVWLLWRGSEYLFILVHRLFFHDPVSPTDPSRRQFLLQTTNTGVLGVAGILAGYGLYQARRAPGIVNLEIPIANLPQTFAGFRIVQITDIHAGLTVKRDWIETIVEHVHALKPDLIAFTGDLADGSVPHLRNDVEPFADLRAPHGKFFITGNHEYYSGAIPWIEEAGRLGYDVLMNEHRRIERNGSSIILAGVTDYSAGQFIPSQKSDPAAALHDTPADMVKILLAHQPRSLYQAEGLRFDLMISGHTHGGQFFPWNLVATLGQPYIKGLHRHNDAWVYVSKGTGYWGPPVRLGARSEITVFTLQKST